MDPELSHFHRCVHSWNDLFINIYFIISLLHCIHAGTIRLIQYAIHSTALKTLQYWRLYWLITCTVRADTRFVARPTGHICIQLLLTQLAMIVTYQLYDRAVFDITSALWYVFKLNFTDKDSDIKLTLSFKSNSRFRKCTFSLAILSDIVFLWLMWVLIIWCYIETHPL